MAANTSIANDPSPPVESTRQLLRRYLFPGIFLGIAFAGLAYSVRQAVLSDNGDFNLHVQQASSFLNGHLYVQKPVSDIAFFDGHYYSVFPPFPAILLIPFVFVFGVAGAKGTLLGILLTAAGAVALFRSLGLLGVRKPTAVWLSAGFFLGTGYWFTLIGSSTVWMLSQTVAVNCTLISLYFLLRGVQSTSSIALAGMFLGFAFTSRQVTIYIAIFALAFIWFVVAEHDRKKFTRAAAAFLAPFSGCLALYLLFNYLRFGNPLETGYQYLVLADSWGGVRVRSYGLFSTEYAPFNLSSMFLSGFQLNFGGPAMTTLQSISPWGTSILFASPFLLAAFYARGHKLVIAAAWVAIALSLIHMLLYFNNGYVQVNTNRFTLDFIPLLMVLCGLGVKTAPPILWKAGIVWAIALNFLAFPVIQTMMQIPSANW